MVMAGVLAIMNGKFNREITSNGEVIGLSLSFYSFLTRLPLWLFSNPSPSLDVNYITTIASMALGHLYVLMGGIAFSLYSEKGYKKVMKRIRQYVTKMKKTRVKQGNNSVLSNIFQVISYTIYEKYS
jgi:hypothetical protein